jgi:hypothetical protein
MTPERSEAYGRVIHTLTELGPAKLQPDELDRLRDAADSLLFSAEGEETAVGALDDAQGILDHLVDSGRWTGERADQLADDLTACGPLARAV